MSAGQTPEQIFEAETGLTVGDTISFLISESQMGIGDDGRSTLRLTGIEIGEDGIFGVFVVIDGDPLETYNDRSVMEGQTFKLTPREIKNLKDGQSKRPPGRPSHGVYLGYELL